MLAELERRRAVNPRFSMRAFARTLGVSHSAVSRICQGRSRPSAATLARLEARLGASAVSASDALRDQRLEGLVRLVEHRAFKADARWLAVRLGVSLDEVQVLLHDALRHGRLTMTSASTWTTPACED